MLNPSKDKETGNNEIKNTWNYKLARNIVIYSCCNTEELTEAL